MYDCCSYTVTALVSPISSSLSGIGACTVLQPHTSCSIRHALMCASCDMQYHAVYSLWVYTLLYQLTAKHLWLFYFHKTPLLNLKPICCLCPEPSVQFSLTSGYAVIHMRLHPQPTGVVPHYFVIFTPDEPYLFHFLAAQRSSAWLPCQACS